MYFSQMLEEYLTERDRQNSDYYEGRFLGERKAGRERMGELATAMDTVFIRLEANVNVLKEYANE